MRIPTYFHSAALFVLLAAVSQSVLAEEDKVVSQSTLTKHQEQEEATLSDHLENDSFPPPPTKMEEGTEPLPAPTEQYLRSGRKLYHYHGNGGKGKGKGYHGHVHCYHYPCQPYRPHPLPPIVPPPPPVIVEPPPTIGRRFLIRHIPSGLYLENAGGLCYDGNNVQLYTYHGGANQIWYEGQNNSIMSSCCQNMAIDIQGGSCYSNSNVYLWTYHGRENQQFVFYGHRDYIHNYSCGVVLTAASRNGGNVVTRRKNGWGATNQIWEKIFV